MATTPRILVSDKLAPEGVDVFKSAGFDVDVKTGMAPDELYGVIGEYDGLVVRSATKAHGDFWNHASKLKVIGRAGSGTDNIDKDRAASNGCWVMNTPGGNNVSAAEHAIALMMTISRHVAKADASMKAGKWEKSKFKGFEVTGKTLGLVGLGQIGSIVADRARGLRMNVLASDPFVTQDNAPEGVFMVALEEVLESADYVSIHCPLLPATRGLIGAAELAKMKSSAFLLHAARGGIVDESALFDALSNGTIRGAALDVWETEPTPGDNPLLTLPNVLATPHLGASTTEAQVRVAVQVAEQIVTFFKTGEVLNPVNKAN